MNPLENILLLKNMVDGLNKHIFEMLIQNPLLTQLGEWMFTTMSQRRNQSYFSKSTCLRGVTKICCGSPGFAWRAPRVVFFRADTLLLTLKHAKIWYFPFAPNVITNNNYSVNRIAESPLLKSNHSNWNCIRYHPEYPLEAPLISRRR